MNHKLDDTNAGSVPVFGIASKKSLRAFDGTRTTANTDEHVVSYRVSFYDQGLHASEQSLGFTALAMFRKTIDERREAAHRMALSLGVFQFLGILISRCPAKPGTSDEVLFERIECTLS